MPLVLVYGHYPHVDEAAGKDVDEGHRPVEEAVLGVPRPLEEPLEDPDKHKVDQEDDGDLTIESYISGRRLIINA